MHYNLTDGFLNITMNTEIPETLVIYPRQSIGIMLSTDRNKLLLLGSDEDDHYNIIHAGELIEAVRQN